MPPDAVDPGARVGHFEVVAPLGAGGMGRVYRARDPRLGREVALKLLQPAVVDEHATERFMREARAASALSHPNIVTVYDIGESADGWFIAMELVRGVTLAGFAARHPPGAAPLAPVLDLAAQAARALAAAHEAGIVHRDVKPENLMRRDDGYLKVLDFGLARLTHPDAASDTAERLTVSGTVMGTRRYFAPEQAAGESAGPPADVFALGVVLHELLTGRHPFPGDTPLARLAALLTGTPESLGTRADAPPALQALLLRMLDVEPAARPSAATVAAELAALAAPGTLTPSGAVAVVSSTLPAALPAPAKPHAGILVGRDGPLATVRAAVARAEAGHGSLLLVTGEAGVGKTALVECCLGRDGMTTAPEGAGLAGAGEVLVARGRCSERLAGTEAYLPVLEALDAALAADASGRIRNLMRRVAPTWLQLVTGTPADGAAERSSPDAAGLLAASPERVKREIVALVTGIANAAPVALFIDDLHWADASTSDLVAYLAPRLAGVRALIVGTYRAADMRRTRHPFLDVQLDLQARGVCEVLALDALDADAVSEYLARRYPGHQFPPSFAALLHARTEGHPLFLGDVLSDLGARGVIADRGGHWQLVGDLTEIARDLPASVRSMIERKIAQLGGDDRRLLGAASVQGTEFDAAVVAAALGIDAADVEERLATLEYAYAFVRRVGEAEFPDRTLTVRYRFAHALYHDALHAALAPSRRVDLAGRIAAALERRHASQPGEAAAALAALWVAARQPARAAAAYAAAATRAGQLFAYAEADALARGGLAQVALLDAGPERDVAELPLRLSLGFTDLVRLGFHHPDTAREMRRALAICRELGTVPQLAPVLWGLCVFSIASGNPTQGVEVAEELRALADNLDDPAVGVLRDSALLAYLYVGQSRRALETAERAAEAPPELRRALRAVVGSDPVVISHAVSSRAAWHLGDFTRAEALITLALDEAGRSRDPRERAFVALHAAWFEIHAGRAAEAARRAAAAVALCDEYGVSSERSWNEAFLGMALTRLGRHAEGIATMRRAITTLEAMQSWVSLPIFYGALAHAQLAEGAFDDAQASVAAGLAIAERIGEPMGIPDLLRARAAWHLATADRAHAPAPRADVTANAFADLYAALDAARAMEARVDEAQVTEALSRLFAAEGRAPEALAFIDYARANWAAAPRVPAMLALDALAATLRRPILATDAGTPPNDARPDVPEGTPGRSDNGSY